ncbi:MAG: hypothetical protein KatS3mg085_835 [Candidatus Dojkabacteria bacterium]|nr:MAG: hypothetical protein KatS3mg085_835 [Candidatus Dojkabacteria bacterium]
MKKNKKNTRNYLFKISIAILVMGVGVILVFRGVILLLLDNENLSTNDEKQIEYNSPIELTSLTKFEIKNYNFWSGLNSIIDYEDSSWVAVKNRENLLIGKIDDKFDIRFVLSNEVDVIKRFKDNSFLFIQNDSLGFLNNDGTYGILKNELPINDAPTDLFYDEVNKIIYILTQNRLLSLPLSVDNYWTLDISTFNLNYPVFWSLDGKSLEILDKKGCWEVFFVNKNIVSKNCEELSNLTNKFILNNYKIYDLENDKYIEDINVDFSEKVFLNKNNFLVINNEKVFYNDEKIFETENQTKFVFEINEKFILVTNNEILEYKDIPVSLVSYPMEYKMFSSDSQITLIPLFGVYLN